MTKTIDDSISDVVDAFKSMAIENPTIAKKILDGVIGLLGAKHRKDRATMFMYSKKYGELAPYNSLQFFLEQCHVENGNLEAERIFIDQYIKAIEESGVDPKKFAKTNKIDSKRLFGFYKDVFVAPAFHNHDVDSYQHMIVNGSKMVKLHDFLGLKIKTIKSPSSLGEHPRFEEDFTKALDLCSEEDRQNFARLFSKGVS